MDTIRLNAKLIASLGEAKFLSVGEMIDATINNKSTWYRILKTPEKITLQQLLAIANGLHIPVRRFFLTDGKEAVVKRCEDYIVDDYQPCGYDADALRRMVESRHDATWQKAAAATGITRDNLKNSLLAVRRTPVTRFLDACQALKIDPFTILLDPNPEPKPKGRRAPTADSPLHAEVKLLRRDLESLNRVVDDLKQKYESLLRDHEALVRRISVNIENINNSSVSIATDSHE